MNIAFQKANVSAILFVTSLSLITSSALAQNKAEILKQVTGACDGASGLAVSGQRAKINVKKGLDVETQGDNSIEIKKDGVLLEKIEVFTAADRQRCIDSLLNFYTGTGNPLLDAAGANSGDYSVFVKDLKIKFLGFDPQRSSIPTGIPHLIFSFKNTSQLKATVSGADSCNLNNWKFSYRGKQYNITKTASLSQNGPSQIGIEAGQILEISYIVDSLSTPAYGAENNANSTCGFYVSFGAQALAYKAIAITNSPLN